jgi:hypothetical protein
MRVAGRDVLALSQAELAQYRGVVVSLLVKPAVAA